MAGGNDPGSAQNFPVHFTPAEQVHLETRQDCGGRSGSSNLSNVGSLRPFLTLHDLELDVIAFL